jgi:hypothetical protein
MDLNILMDRQMRLAEEGNWDEWALGFAPGATIHLNFSPDVHSVDDLIAGFRAMDAVSYSNIRRVIRDGLVVEYHDVTLSLGGKEAVADVALIVEFNDEGKATSVNEYLDSAALATLME